MLLTIYREFVKIQFSALADFELWEMLQTEDEELKHTLDGRVEFSGTLSKVQMPDTKALLYCETSGEETKFYIPQTLRYKAFESLNGFSYLGIRATGQLIY